MRDEFLTLRQIVEATGIPYYKVLYLKNTGKLPIAEPSRGPGFPTKYRNDAIEIVNSLMKKNTTTNEQGVFLMQTANNASK